MDKTQVALLKYFSKEHEYQVSKSSNLSSKEGAAKLISKEAEIKSIVDKCQTKNPQSDDVPFIRAPTKYEAVYNKFDMYYAKGSPPLSFNLNTAILAGSVGSEEEMDEKDLIGFNIMKKTLAICWEGKAITQAEKDEFKEILKTAKGRKSFGEAFNQYRKNGMFAMKEKAYTLVAELLLTVMNQIEADNDVNAALNVMILSQTFYIDHAAAARIPEGSDEKIFLQWGIQKHPFWHNKKLWERAIEISIEEEMAHQPGPEETKAERQLRMSNVAFGKMGAFAQNMLQFDISKEEVEGLIIASAEEMNLPEPYVTALHVYFIFILSYRADPKSNNSK